MRWFWIDRFTEVVSGKTATAIKVVSLSEEHLHDHFLGIPTMPNSLILEGMAQTPITYDRERRVEAQLQWIKDRLHESWLPERNKLRIQDK